MSHFQLGIIIEERVLWRLLRTHEEVTEGLGKKVRLSLGFN
jgi:hypothetical protein